MSGWTCIYLEYSTLEDCRTEYVSLTTAQYRNSAISAGGLVGHGVGVKIQNCYSSNLELRAEKGVRANGIGGIAGCIDTYGTISNVYAHGTISTTFGGTGGILGAGSANIYQAASVVNITSTTGDAGGILGVANTSVSVDNTLSIGNISGTGSGLNRIYGNVAGSIVTCAVTNGAAYSGQVIGNSTPRKLERNLPFKAGELTSQGLFRNYGRLGNQL